MFLRSGQKNQIIFPFLIPPRHAPLKSLTLAPKPDDCPEHITSDYFVLVAFILRRYKTTRAIRASLHSMYDIFQYNLERIRPIL